jgi:hypothetical protein
VCGPAHRRPATRAASSTSNQGRVTGRDRALGGASDHGEDRALHRIAHRLVRALGGHHQALGQRGPIDGTVVAGGRVWVRPRRIWERITPLLPRAPMSAPWPMALHTAGQVVVDAVELGRDRLPA